MDKGCVFGARGVERHHKAWSDVSRPRRYHCLPVLTRESFSLEQICFVLVVGFGTCYGNTPFRLFEHSEHVPLHAGAWKEASMRLDYYVSPGKIEVHDELNSSTHYF